jgi:pilus assembly protein Flp/PilA
MFFEGVKMLERVRRILQQDEGQTLVEYALIIAAVALTLTVALTGISDALARAFNNITSTLNGISS